MSNTRDPNLSMVVSDALDGPQAVVTPDMLRDLYMDVLGASSPRRSAQYVAAVMYRLETGDTVSGIDREAFVEHENQLYRDTWDTMNDRRQNGYPNG